LNLDLPLSWKHTSETDSSFKSVNLFGRQWFSLAEISRKINFQNLLQQSIQTDRKRLVLRGCNKAVSNNLQSLGFKSVYIGQEAILDLHSSPFSKKSLQSLVSRGIKHGHIEEISYSTQNKEKIEQLKVNCVYGNRPQLQYLFRTTFEADMRCFIFTSKKGTILAAITISENSPGKMHSELLLRHGAANVGTMEALIYHIFFKLKQEGYRYWSLGEVPFVRSEQAMSVKETVIGALGRRLNFIYNSDGLFHFKNKFSPRWQPVYLCATPGVGFLSLLVVLIHSKLLKLVLFGIFRRAD